MKKQTMIILIILIVILIAVVVAVTQNVQQERELAKYNSEYEKYLHKQILGTEVATLINKAMNSNEKNSVEKDENDYYIHNNTNSIKIYVMLELEGEYFPMEGIFQLGITEFVKNFNIIDFECTKINYHEQTGKISELYFEVI